MIEKKLDFELIRRFRHGSRQKSVVIVKNFSSLRYIERNFKVVAYFPFINALGIECDFRGASALSQLPYVEYVTRQAKVSTLDNLMDEFGTTGEKALSRVDLLSATNALSIETSLTGKGSTLCVLDTGVSPHLDLCLPKSRIKEFCDLDGGLEYAYDDNGHGTFVAGVAMGNGVVSGRKVKGVAPDAELVAVKVISHTGECGAFKILEGMQWVVNNAKRLNIKTVCMSFGADPLDTSDPLKIGAETLVKNGITVVCAAGNSGNGNLKSPGISPQVITVGAVDSTLSEARFSSKGVYFGVKKPDIYARGVAVKGLATNASYIQMSGTSVSAPYIAGAVCLLHERYKGLTPSDAKRIILASAETHNNLPVLDIGIT
ncbi:MAG: S8 family serine peptidase [Clostridia bacterium]|nr:S8 family serine peptidase [Clostridia bacterium]